MKVLRFPKELALRLQFDGRGPKSSPTGEAGGNELAMIEKNCSELIMAAVMLEARMIEAVSKLLFGCAAEARTARDFFAHEIMETSDFS